MKGWSESRYNVVVKQVEGCSDLLVDVANRLAAVTGEDRVARRLLRHVRAAVLELDKRALRMIALYDPTARAMCQRGLLRDLRRGPVQHLYPEAEHKYQKRIGRAGRVYV